MSTWKKVHVESANTTHGTITANLGAATNDIDDSNLSHNIVVSATDGTTAGALTVAEVTFGTAAFDAASSFATAAQGAAADSALQSSDVAKDLIAGAGLSGGTNDNVLFGADGDVTFAVDINGASDLGSDVASGDEILVADVSDSNNIKKTTVADIVGAVSTGVTTVDITGDSGSHTPQNGAVSLAFTGQANTPIDVAVSDGGAEIQFNINTLTTGTPAGSADYFMFRDDTTGNHVRISIQNLAEEILDGGELTATTLTNTTLNTADTFLVADGGRGGTANDISVSNLTAYFNDAAVLTALANTDVNVSDANLRTRLAALDNAGGDLNIGDSNDDLNVIIRGNLQVNGTTTTVNSTELTVNDINITIASGAANAAAADGAGITVDVSADGNYDTDPQLQWNSTHETFSQWKMIKGVTGETDAYIAGMVPAADYSALDALTPGIGTFGMVGSDLYIQTA